MSPLRHFLVICFLLFIPSVFTSGCASIVTGHNQVLSVDTRDKDGNQVVGASCKCVNDKGTYFVNTPGTIMVHRCYSDLLVTCTKPNMEPGTAVVKSSAKAMTAGNIIFGGLIGLAVDAGTGAAFDYPSVIRVIMGESTQIDAHTQPAQKEEDNKEEETSE